MKIAQTLLFSAAISAIPTAQAAVTYDFLNKGGTFDGLNSQTVELIDGSLTVDMTISANSTFTLNSNSDAFGIDDGTEDSATIDFIDGTDEILTISFSEDIEFNFIDFAGIGSDAADGASLTVGFSSFDLYTGQSNFNGSADTFTPTSSILLSAGQTIILTGTSSTSSYELNSINVTVVPEPGSFALLAGFAAFVSIMFRRRAVK